ncbi:hypothetical protein IUY40_09290 [Flavobacterium sp. ALJ2]|uniref:hypothetical protein n=1 Tax=Flavobacterium sp. ALJ2 TaxID=2786960 RepID=UPI0018A0E83A|nr:hypothetical protein [Flavobacterium sp. ALJ2]MBF7091735.1 hypothetical protein [Flavobacterium sp. ALJ2]
MKYILTTILCLIQITCFSQKIKYIKYQTIDEKDYFIHESTVYKPSIALYKKTYKNGTVNGSQKVNLKKGNYIAKTEESFMKFSINTNGNLDGKLEIQEMYKNELIKSIMQIKNGYLQNRTLYDSIGNIKTDTKRYYYKDSIKDISILNNGSSIHKIKYITGKTIIRKYDSNGKLIDNETYYTAAIEPRP